MPNYQLYYDYLTNNVMAPFYAKRFEKLQELKLKAILKRKNPYLFKAKNIITAEECVRSILDAYLSSQEETLFGNLLEGFAIYVSETLYNGFKSQHQSIDLEFQRDKTYYIVSIKSGPNWGNRDQISQMRTSFKRARVALRTNGIEQDIIAINGCIYGRDRTPFKSHEDKDKTYYKYCGQEFWHLVSGDEFLYREIITPIDKEAKQKDERFKQAYAAKINEMTLDFISNFTTDYQIDWSKLIDFVSQKQTP